MSGNAAAMAELLRAAIADMAAAGLRRGDPADAAEMLALLRRLHATGRRDLPLGRLLEGHVDAVQIVLRYGDADQRAALERAVEAGAMLGVWNAGLRDEPLLLEGDRLTGGKSYASGAGILTHALVTAETPQGAQLLLLDLARTPPAIDDSWWQVSGMQRSATHLVRWSGAAIAAAYRIGRPGDYAREPFFSGGALRFVAVHAGGVGGLFDLSREHLVRAGRAGDPQQAARLAQLYGLAQACADAVRSTAQGWFEQADETRLPRVAAARLAVADHATQAIALAQAAVGLEGMFLAHPLSAMLTDLAVYLRQPAPDAQRMRVAAAAAAGALVPTL